MNALESKIESLLFIAGKPLSVKKIAEIVDAKPQEVAAAAESLCSQYASTEGRGMHIMKVGQNYQMATRPEQSELVESFIKSEQTGELTKPSLETLTIIAYRGPISKVELEQIRGVNCSLILRNLLIRGLVEARYDKALSITVYEITMQFLEFLGLSRIEELPEYEKLHDDVRLRQLLEQEKAREEESALQATPTEHVQTKSDE